MKKRIIIIVASVLVVLGLGTGGLIWANQSKKSTTTSTSQTQTKTTTIDATPTVTYKGQSGETALALLQKIAKVDMTGTGDNAYVTGINGVSADSTKKQYWEFDINGTSASVGAGSYVTKDTDTITWKLSTY